jgi:hypothetical protein
MPVYNVPMPLDCKLRRVSDIPHDGQKRATGRHLSPWIPFWICGIFCVVIAVLVARFVPETKGKSLEDIERFWLKHKKEQPRER